MSRIAFVVSGKSPITEPGGLGAYSYNVGKILNELGFKVYIIGFSSRDEALNLGFATLIHFKNPYERLLTLGAAMSGPIFVRKMEEVIDCEAPAEVVVYSTGIWGIAGVKLSKKLLNRNIKVKTIVGYFTTYKHEYRGQLLGTPVKDYGWISHILMRSLYSFASYIYSPIERRMLTATDTIAVHYNSTRTILLNEFPSLRKDKIVKIPYYIDLYARASDVKFAPAGIRNPSIPTVSIICRQDPRKGINTFLKAVRILKGRGVNFNCLIAGSGIFANRNKYLAKKLGVSDYVNFLGFVDSVEEVLDNTDIYVLPSVEEGSGAISLLEAMKKGVAIITTRCDGIPEDFVNNETGILITPCDARQLADAIETLVKDHDLRHKLAQTVKADYCSRFTFEKMKSGIKSLIRQE